MSRKQYQRWTLSLRACPLQSVAPLLLFLNLVSLTAIGITPSFGAPALVIAEKDTAEETASESSFGSTPAVALVLQFWREVWNPPYDFQKIDELMTEDFILTSAGKDMSSRAIFKEWVRAFQSKILELRLYPLETFANKEGNRVVSRWRATGKNHGILGTEPDNRSIEFTGIAIWEIRDGKLAHNWVERSAWELYQQLTAKP